ncbi:helix-turn-helix domain-containing protein [Aliirhizobium terrae]|uniref:IclR family transcriptional regulator n=1 Tax=Terrirhizobium terrae TaxID=2926709 RepID=UPI002574D4D0|nr:helix-turn-helix domain-containing protein [Rhizobium sp. CC-CFT758]WJH41139.1 helix-turn-helix domain-containing protein [Rhizobium sp. CC-CFT758]
MSGRGVERVLDMIEWFAASPEGASLSEIAAALAMPKSSALLMLQSLTERGYIQKLGSGGYQLLRLPGEISPDGRNYGALIALVSPYLYDAVQETGESGFVAVLEGSSIRYLNKVLPKREILYDRDIGPTRPAHKVASGVVLLAAGSDAEVEAYAMAVSFPKKSIRSFEKPSPARAHPTSISMPWGSWKVLPVLRPRSSMQTARQSQHSTFPDRRSGSSKIPAASVTWSGKLQSRSVRSWRVAAVVYPKGGKT